MSSAKQTGKTVAKAIAYILVVLVIAGVIGVVVKFTGGFTSEFKTFYVSVDGTDVLTSGGGYSVSTDNPINVEVKYTFGAAGGNVSGYSVKVVPHIVEGKDFDFLLDGQAYSFQAEKDLTSGFDIEYGETSFTLAPKGNVVDILQAVYPNNEISGCEDKGYDDMFSLVVASYNGESEVTLYFSVIEGVRGITLDKGVMVF